MLIAQKNRREKRRTGRTSGSEQKDGTLMEVEIISSPLPFRGRNARLVQALDVTEHRWTEEALRESEARYRAVVECVPYGMVVAVEDKLVYVNPAAIKLAGVNSVDDLIGRKVLEFVSYAFVGSLLPGTPERIRTLAVWADGTVAPNFEYQLDSTSSPHIFCFVKGLWHPGCYGDFRFISQLCAWGAAGNNLEGNMLSRLSIPFFGANTRRQKRAKTVATRATVDASDTQPIASAPGQFHIVLGETKKYLLEGRLLYPSDVVLKLDGQDARNQFRSSIESGLEIYEGEFGGAEKLSVRIERETGVALKGKVRILVNGRLAKVCEIRPKWGRRHLFFQVALPSVFLLLITCFILSRPEVANFYSGIFSRSQPQLQQRYPSKMRAFPTPAKQKNLRDSASNVA